LLANNYPVDPRLASLVDNLETWICPIHNPDGYVSTSRYNAHGYDLNRIFPDPVTDPVDTIEGQEPENIAFMQLGYANRFSLGINYHGGELVVNYPWDSKPAEPPYYAPDNDLFYSLSRGYADLNPDILGGAFTDGVTVGWEWYVVRGGFQDWAYNWRDELHVTIEVSDVKAPNFTLMDGFWNNNREAMLVWMERALTGVSGVVVDDRTSLPLDAQITIDENDRTLRTDADAGDYHRPLLPGEYHLSVTASCHLSQNTSVIVSSEGSVVQDFSLQPTGISGTLSDQATGEPISGTIRILSGTEEVVSDPATGVYQISLCPGTYTLQVEAAGYDVIERQVTLETLLVENFTLSTTVEQKIFLPTVLK
jgi:carboxypeptidase D